MTTSTDDPLPDITIRLPATYAWAAMAGAALFFLLGLTFVVINPHRNQGIGLFLCTASLAAMIGANYWRHHLHVVARLTPRQLILRRDGPVNWHEIAAVDIKEIHGSYRGVSERSRFACIRLRNRPPPKNRLDAVLHKFKHAVTGYDIIVPASELSRPIEWFVAECKKRIAAEGEGRLSAA
jgi:hypothetical protein